VSTFAQETNGDLKITNGQLVLVTRVADVVAIELRNRFLFVKGEWFLDTRLGVPYLAFVFVKNPDLIAIRSLFRKVIIDTNGVVDVLEMNLSFDSTTRKLSFTFRAQCVDGNVVSGGSDQPFIVEP